MAKTLLILNDPPCGTERSYKGLRLAGTIAKRDDGDARVFLIGAKGAHRSNLDELADWTTWADKIITF